MKCLCVCAVFLQGDQDLKYPSWLHNADVHFLATRWQTWAKAKQKKVILFLSQVRYVVSLPVFFWCWALSTVGLPVTISCYPPPVTISAFKCGCGYFCAFIFGSVWVWLIVLSFFWEHQQQLMFSDYFNDKLYVSHAHAETLMYSRISVFGVISLKLIVKVSSFPALVLLE